VSVKKIKEIFKQLNEEGFHLTLFKCEKDVDWDEACKNYYVVFTDTQNKEDIKQQRQLLKEEKCTSDTIELWAEVDEMKHNVINEIRYRNRKEK